MCYGTAVKCRCPVDGTERWVECFVVDAEFKCVLAVARHRYQDLQSAEIVRRHCYAIILTRRPDRGQICRALVACRFVKDCARRLSAEECVH